MCNSFFEKYCDLIGFGLSYLVDKSFDELELRYSKKTIILNWRMAICLFFQNVFSAQKFLIISNQNNQDDIKIQNNPFLGWDLQIILFAWVIQNLHIIFIEGDYLIYGDNDLAYRTTWYKLIDLLLNSLFMSSLVVEITLYNNSTPYTIILLGLVICDFLLDSVELYNYTRKMRKSKQLLINEDEKGGYYLFLLFAFIGELAALVTITQLNFNFEYFSKTIIVYYLCWIILIVFNLIELLFVTFCRSEYCASQIGKNVLNAVQGLGFGVGCIYFTPIAVVIIIYFYSKRLFAFRWDYKKISLDAQ